MPSVPREPVPVPREPDLATYEDIQEGALFYTGCGTLWQSLGAGGAGVTAVPFGRSPPGETSLLPWGEIAGKIFLISPGYRRGELIVLYGGHTEVFPGRTSTDWRGSTRAPRLGDAARVGSSPARVKGVLNVGPLQVELECPDRTRTYTWGAEFVNVGTLTKRAHEGIRIGSEVLKGDVQVTVLAVDEGGVRVTGSREPVDPAELKLCGGGLRVGDRVAFRGGVGVITSLGGSSNQPGGEGWVRVLPLSGERRCAEKFGVSEVFYLPSRGSWVRIPDLDREDHFQVLSSSPDGVRVKFKGAWKDVPLYGLYRSPSDGTPPTPLDEPLPTWAAGSQSPATPTQSEEKVTAPMSDKSTGSPYDALLAALAGMFKAAGSVGSEAGFRISVRQGRRQLRRGFSALAAPRLAPARGGGARARTAKLNELREAITAELDTPGGDALFSAALSGILLVVEGRVQDPKARERIKTVRDELLVQAAESVGQMADPAVDALFGFLVGGATAAGEGLIAQLENLVLSADTATATATATLPSSEAITVEAAGERAAARAP